jgi:hypothetical protein
MKSKPKPLPFRLFAADLSSTGVMKGCRGRRANKTTATVSPTRDIIATTGRHAKTGSSRATAAGKVAFPRSPAKFWSEWLILAGAPQLRPLHHMEFEHVHLQLEAAVSGLGIALASLPLIEKDIESGRLVCPIREPEWCAQDYVLISEHREDDALVKAFRSWIKKNTPGLGNGKSTDAPRRKY